MFFNVNRSLQYVNSNGVDITRMTFYSHEKLGYIKADKSKETKDGRIVGRFYKKTTLDEYIKWYRINLKLREKGVIGANQLVKLKAKDNAST
jgi:uncharacterized protein YbgA (DUF1722 family)